METTMDRRAFLTSSVVAGAAAALGGTTLASASEGAGEGGTNPAASIPPVEPPASWDYEADVIAVGAGGGGLNAAARACQQGLSIIVLEKTAIIGGNTMSATMFTLPGGTKIQDEAEKALPSWPFDIKTYVDFIMNSFHHAYNPDIVKLIGENTGPCFEWMNETYGLEWTLAAAGTYATIAPVGMTVVTDAAYEYATANGAQFLTSTEAAALVVEDGRVVGVKALGSDGSEIYLHALKAVFLCGGGFAANPDLLAEYCPSATERAVSCYLTSTDSGECFRMGVGAGAQVAAKNSFAMFDGGMDWANHGGEWSHYLYDGATQLVRQPWLAIDRTGQRIRYIDSKVGGALTDLATVETSTPGCRSYVFFDANWDEYLQTFGQGACRRPIQDGVDRQPYVPEYYQDYHAGVQDAIDAGLIKKYDTLEELAEGLGLDAGVVTKAVADWNEMVARGEDDFIYPLDPAWLHPVDTPPFYGAELGGMIFQTRCGLAINTKLQVLGTDGTAIPGLYAGWFTAAAGATDILSSMAASIGGVSNSWLGGYLAINAIAEEE